MPAVFDSRVWLGVNEDAVLDYFRWRQADATRCALNGWCYWTLRKEGQSAAQARGPCTASPWASRTSCSSSAASTSTSYRPGSGVARAWCGSSTRRRG
ncbi:hypothetical protein ACN28S_53015 [Cystobacter fuscus]